MARFQCQNCQSTFQSPVVVCPVCGARQPQIDLEKRMLPFVGWGCSGLSVIVFGLILYALLQGPAAGQTWGEHLASGGLVILLCGLPTLATGILFLYLWRRER